MSRQSLSKRSRRYIQRRLKEFNRIQLFLKRLELRIYYGSHSKQLTVDERNLIRDLLFTSIILLPLGYEVSAVTSELFNKTKRNYFRICKILRKAGQRPLSRPTTKVILRKAV